MATVTTCNVCDFKNIYNEHFRYSLPEDILSTYLSGESFDYKQHYTSEEMTRLISDINDLYEGMMFANPIRNQLAVITAGAPGAGKTWKMRQDLEQKTEVTESDTHYAYIDPDDVCLRSMTATYRHDILLGDQSPAARKAAYDKWRPGSNAANHLILANLIREKCAFYFGTTSTSPVTCKFFEFLKQQGYHIRLIHVSAPDDVRWKSIQERDKTFIQTTEADVVQKGELLPQRINDTYLRYADEIEFYYRDGVERDAGLAAVWIRGPDGSEVVGELTVSDQIRYNKIKEIHNAAAKALQRQDLDWSTSVEAKSKIIIKL